MSAELHGQLKQRTKQFALRIIRLSRSLPRNREADVIARQVLRSGTAVAANYKLRPWLDESRELLKMFSASRRTAKS